MSTGPPYEVFLSFRGEDTRNNFAKFLHMMLKKALVHVFIDEENLETGADMNDGLIEAINQSTISIPIISKDFASSYSCLMELENMSKCMDERNHIVIPIFYYIEPRDVRNCKGPFAKSKLGRKDDRKDGRNDERKDERKHRNIEETVIKNWMSALERIGDINGHHLHKENEVKHIEIMERIIREVQEKLKKEDLLPGDLVGVDPHVNCIMEMLDVDFRRGQAVKIGDAHKKVLLIHGLAGVGKTALAKHVYIQLHHLFDACSFQDEIEQRSILSVQNKLISDLHKGDAIAYHNPDKALIHIKERFNSMKVLVLLDGVKCHKQLRKLVGKLDWLGPRSRVILTSQRQDVLGKISDAESFPLEPMKPDEALILFCRKVFGADFPREEFEELSTKIVAATGGLPEALEIVGLSLLHTKSEEVWRETLTKLEEGCNEGVKAVLKKSYGKLNKDEKKIFRDIACFFVGNDKRIPYYMWSDCKCFPATSILALHALSLIKIQDKKICMLEILKKFGREIVKDENSEPCERSRLWNHEEALGVLTSRKGTKKVEALRLEFGDEFVGHTSFQYYHFNGLKNLRFLKLDQAHICGNLRNRLLNLSWLDWRPKIFYNQSLDLHVPNLVILDLSRSQVDKDWGGWKLLVKAKRLKVLKLTDCFQLIDTPKFPLSMELERLFLEGCSKLAFTHQSFSYLEKLVSLNLKQCRRLYKLPNLGYMRGLEELVIDETSISQINFQEGSMKELKTLSARNCEHLTEISNSIGCLKSLKHLALDGTRITTLWESIGSLEKLKTLSLMNCGELTHLPNGIGKLKSLQFLDLSVTAIRELPPIKEWKAMTVLRMRRTFIEEFPKAILNLEQLEEIDFSHCRSLKGNLQRLDFSRLSYLAVLKLSQTQISCLPMSLYRLSRLQKLDTSGCDNLPTRCKLPSKLD